MPEQVRDRVIRVPASCAFSLPPSQNKISSSCSLASREAEAEKKAKAVESSLKRECHGDGKREVDDIFLCLEGAPSCQSSQD
jgi:hypothetical protein